MLSMEIQGLAKEFIEFVVQLIPWRQAGDLEWDKEELEGSGHHGWKVNHVPGMIEKSTEKSQLEKILFKTVSNTEE